MKERGAIIQDFRKKVLEAKQEISDKDFFLSDACGIYLQNLATAVTKTYSNGTKLQITWQNNDRIAYATDRSEITINLNNPFMEMASTRVDKLVAQKGLILHECGHLLFTDFHLAKTRRNAYFEQKKLFPTPEGMEAAEFLTDLEKMNNSVALNFFNVLSRIDNTLEDGFIENMVLRTVPGEGKCLIALRKMQMQDIPSVEDQLSADFSRSIIALNALLCYGKYETIKGDLNKPEVAEAVRFILENKSMIREITHTYKAYDRMKLINTLFCKFYVFFKQNKENEQKEEQKAEQQNGQTGENRQDSNNSQDGNAEKSETSCPHDSSESSETGESGADNQAAKDEDSENGEKDAEKDTETEENTGNFDDTEGSADSTNPEQDARSSESEIQPSGEGDSGSGDSGNNSGNSGIESTDSASESTGGFGEGFLGNPKDADSSDASGNYGPVGTGDINNLFSDMENDLNNVCDSNINDSLNINTGSVLNDKTVDNLNLNQENKADPDGDEDSSLNLPLNSFTGDADSDPEGAAENTSENNPFPELKDVEKMSEELAEETVRNDEQQRMDEELEESVKDFNFSEINKDVSVKLDRRQPLESDRATYEKFVDEGALKVATKLAKEIQAKIKDRQQGGKINGLYNGRYLDRSHLYRMDKRFFCKNDLPEDIPDMAISVLIDASGSMHSNNKISEAMKTALIIYEFGQMMHIPVTVYGHNYHSSMHLYSLAEFNTLDGQDKYRICSLSPSGCNRDGMALRFCADSLAKRREQNKFVFIISDGKPSEYNSMKEAYDDIRNVLLDYSRKNVRFIAFGLGNDQKSIEDIYCQGMSKSCAAKFVSTSEPEQLPKAVVKAIKDLL